MKRECQIDSVEKRMNQEDECKLGIVTLTEFKLVLNLTLHFMKDLQMTFYLESV